MSRYELTEFPSKKGEPCSHPQLIPGLDASICPVCKATYATPLPIRQTAKPIMRKLDTGLPPLDKFLPQTPTFEYAITLHRPWAHAIAHLGKDIENRKTNLLCVKPGEWLAIHAGRGYHFPAQDWIIETLQLQVPDPADDPTGIVAIAQFMGNVTASDSPWFIPESVGWKLANAIALTAPVDCPGQQGLWKPSAEIKREVAQQLIQIASAA
jgi:hypothetical protein